MWRLRQVVKTPPSHGGFKGSNPLGVTKMKIQPAGCGRFFFCRICNPFTSKAALPPSMTEQSRLLYSLFLVLFLFLFLFFLLSFLFSLLGSLLLGFLRLELRLLLLLDQLPIRFGEGAF